MCRSREANEAGSASCAGRRPVEAGGAGQCRRLLAAVGAVVHEVVRAAVYPPGVPVGDQLAEHRGVQGECAAEVPSGQGEHAGLPRVEHGQQEVRPA